GGLYNGLYSHRTMKSGKRFIIQSKGVVRMKKSFQAALASALALSLLSACGSIEGGSGNASTNGAEKPSGNQQVEERKPVTLSAMVQNHASTPFNEDWLIWD